MKKIILLVIVFFMSNMLFAGPFGLEMGMTLDDIKEKCGGEVKCVQDGLYAIKPPRPSIYFCDYFTKIDGSFGLHLIAGTGEITSYKECMLLLGNLSNKLKSYYGEPQEVKRLKDSDPVYMTYESSDTIIQYGWKQPECKKLEKENVYHLRVGIVEAYEDGGFVSLIYEFDNQKNVMEQISPF